MKLKRTLTTLLVAIFVLNLGIITASATERASHHLDSYTIAISAEGGGRMIASFGVFGTRTMDKIGVYSLKVEEETTPNHWVSNGTTFGSADPDLFYAYDTSAHAGDFTFYGTPGTRYRVTLTVYAALGSGSDTATIVSGLRLCK